MTLPPRLRPGACRTRLLHSAVLLLAATFVVRLAPARAMIAEADDTAAAPLLGVTAGNAPWDMSGVDTFERDAGRRVSIINWYQGWGDNLDAGAPDLSLLDRIAARGATPMISWGPWDYRLGTINQPQFAYSQIADGAYDGYVAGWAAALASWGRPVLLRFAWEMNGDWMAWGMGVNGNTPQSFVAAWQHIHDLFAQYGASNVQWVWSPNVVEGTSVSLASLYPGDEYVDWLALDGYNRVDDGWESFTQIFWNSYQQITALSDKPLMVAETSSSEARPGMGVSKAQWIESALTEELPNNFPRVRALIWFNDDKSGVEANGYDWRIESSPDSVASFRQAASALR